MCLNQRQNIGWSKVQTSVDPSSQRHLISEPRIKRLRWPGETNSEPTGRCHRQSLSARCPNSNQIGFQVEAWVAPTMGLLLGIGSMSETQHRTSRRWASATPFNTAAALSHIEISEPLSRHLLAIFNYSLQLLTSTDATQLASLELAFHLIIQPSAILIRTSIRVFMLYLSTPFACSVQDWVYFPRGEAQGRWYKQETSSASAELIGEFHSFVSC